MKEVFGKAAVPLLVAAAMVIGLAYYNLAEADGHSAARSFSPSTVAAGGELRVTVTVAGYGNLGRVVETIPPGFDYLGSDLPANADIRRGQTIGFILRPPPVSAFTYRLRAPSPTTTTRYTFSGYFQDQDPGPNPPAVGGATSVEVRAASSPPGVPDATDASLSSLSVTDGDGMAIALTDADGNMVDFASDIDMYYAAVDNDVDTIDVMATATDENAAVSGTGAMSLSEGNNTVEVEVTAADGTTTMTYTVVVTREESSDEARLLRIYDMEKGNGNGVIDRGEAVRAVLDFQAGDLSRADAVRVVLLFQRGG